MIAQRLGTVGHLEALTRLAIGEWLLQDARPLSWFTQASTEMITRQMLPLSHPDARVQGV
jgi:hypothetical protein